MSIALIYQSISYKINGILYKVHNEIGRYCNEKQYSDLIEKYFIKYKINFEREKILPIMFEGEKEGRNKVDFLINSVIVLEIKTKRFISREDYYQVMRYLKALNKKLAILVNFHSKFLRPKRILNSSAKE